MQHRAPHWQRTNDNPNRFDSSHQPAAPAEARPRTAGRPAAQPLRRGTVPLRDYQAEVDEFTDFSDLDALFKRE